MARDDDGDTGAHAGAPEAGAPRLVIVGLMLGMFLAALESTVVATAMRRVTRELGGEHLYAAPFSAYLLFATVSSPLWGRASDLFGRRRLYLLGIGLFLVGSALCGAATSMAWLVAARCLQGLGGGAVMTLTLTIVGELFTLERRARIQGVISGIWGLAGLLGPLVGGLIVDHASWRWVFYVNLPFGLLGAALVGARYHDRPAGTRVRLDLVGAGLFAAGSGLLVWGLEERAAAFTLAGAGLFAAAVVAEVRHAAPILPVRVLRRRLPLVALLGNLLGGAAYFGCIAYLPLLAQGVAGTGAAAAGAVLTPMVLGWTVTSIIAVRLLIRAGVRRLALTGFALLAAGLAGFCLLALAPLWALGAAGFLAGSGMGFAMAALLIGTQEAVPRTELGAVTASLLFARSMGGAVGVAIMHVLIGPGLAAGGHDLAEGLRRAFVFALALALVALGLAAGLRPPPPPSARP